MHICFTISNANSCLDLFAPLLVIILARPEMPIIPSTLLARPGADFISGYKLGSNPFFLDSIAILFIFSNSSENNLKYSSTLIKSHYEKFKILKLFEPVSYIGN